MPSSSENEEAHAALSTTTQIHIADLNSITITGGRHIDADIVVVYPYSSKTKELSLRLVERDVSLRKAKGQVKVTFHDAVAREVAESRPGIGDTVRLALRNVELVEEQDEVATPGKKAGFTLHFHRAVQMQLSSDHGQKQLVEFVASTTPPTSPHQLDSPSWNAAVIAFETPASDRIFNISTTRAVFGSSSLLRSSQRISSNPFPGSMVDPFTQEDGHIEGRGRKRAKFARHSGAWRFADSDEDGADIDHLQEDNGIDAVSAPVTHVRVVESVVNSTEALLVKNAFAEPIADEFVELEDPRVLKHNAVEYGAASSIDDHLGVRYKDFEELSSPESQTSVRSESSRASADHVIPVERMSLSPGERKSITSPRLEPVGSSGLPVVSPFASRNQYFSPFLDHTPVADARAHAVEPPNTFFQAPDSEVPNAIPVEEPDALGQPFDHEVDQLVRDGDAQLARPPRDGFTQDIDLDALQQQIDIENGTDFLTETAEEAIEAEDSYGAPASLGPELKVGSEEHHTSPRRVDMPAADADNPIVLDGNEDDDDAEEMESTYKNEDDGTKKAGEPYEDEEDEDENDLRTGPSKDVQSNLTDYGTEDVEEIEVQEIVEENYNTDEETDVVAESSSICNLSPMSASPDTAFAKDNQNNNEPQPQHTYVGLEGSDTREQSEDDLAVDNVDQLTSAKAKAAPIQSPLFLDGVSDEVLPVDRPLLPVDLVDFELPPANVVQTSETVDGIDVRGEPTAEEVTLGAASSHIEFESRKTIIDELPTPQATQSSEPLQGDQVKLRPGLTHEVPPTPTDSQDPPPREADCLLVVPGGVIPPLPQIDGTPARRVSRRFLDQPRMSDDVYSDYFTPRMSAAMPKDPTPVESADSSEGQTALKLSRPVSKVFGDVDGGLQKRPLEPSARMRQPTAADDVPWASSRGMATDLGYYVYLKYLGDYYDQLVDVLAVCTADVTAPKRAKSGPKDFNTTIHLADSSASVDSDTTTIAQIFRPNKHAIPIVKRGDVVLLRNFKVQTQLHKPFLLSTDESAWVVFSSAGKGAVVVGPPVEFGNDERASVSWLFGWWTAEGKDKYSDLPTQMQPDPANDRTVIKKPAPQLSDLRRSPRRTRSDHAVEGTRILPEQDQSPHLNPQSPTFSFGIESSSMAPKSAWAACLSSPTSVRTTRSTESASVSVVEARKLDQPVAVPPPPTSARSNTKQSDSRHVQNHSISTPHHAETEQDTRRRNPIEDDGAATSEAETSASSKRRHRHERKSTSLVHELRDGTQYIDIDDFEVVSVNEEETEDDDQEDTAQISPALVQPDSAAEDVSPHSVMAEIPRKRGRGRPRKMIQPSQSYEQGDEAPVSDTPSRLYLDGPRNAVSIELSRSDATAAQSEGRPQSSHSQGGAAAAGNRMMTRSKTVKEHNVHELRDRTVYED